MCTEYENGLIVASFKAGKKPKEISEDIGVPIRTLQKKWRTYLDRGTLTPKSKSGSPKKTSEREDTRIVREVRKDPFTTCKQIAINIGRPELSPETIRRRLHKVGKLKSHHAARKPFLRAQNRLHRLRWAREHVNWTASQWRSVLWSDESKFVIRYGGARRVWRRQGERYKPRNTMKTVKHDKKVMVWGCFNANGVGHLHRINGIMNAPKYHTILVQHMIPSARGLNLNGDPWIFQQDNDPKHNAKINKAYLRRKGITVMDWPAQSPDLNPIENLWSELDRRLRKRVCHTENDLFDILKQGWESLDQDYLEKLVDSMPRRCKAVIDAKGHGTKY